MVAAPAHAAGSGTRPGHLLLALLDGDEARALVTAAGADPSAVAESVRAALATASDASDVPGFTPASRKAIQLAHRESLRLNAEHVGPGHLLLGVLRVTGEPEIGGLRDLGLTREAVAAALDAA